jgi:hypothetical protein
VDLLSSNKKGRGATRVCHFYDGSSVKEIVTAIDDMHMVIKLSDHLLPMAEIFAEFVAKPLDSNKTELSMVLHYTVRYGPIGYVLGVTLINAQMKSLLKTVLAGINERVETGESIQKKRCLVEQ